MKRFLNPLMTALLLVSCGKNDDADNPDNVKLQNTGEYFLATTGSNFTEYVLQSDRLQGADIPISSNIKELEMSGYLWSFKDNLAVGLVYQQGNAGLGYAYYRNGDGTLSEGTKFQISQRFTSYGFFKDYFITSVGGVSYTDTNGNTKNDGATFVFRDTKNALAQVKEKTIPTLGIAPERPSEQATFSGVVDLGNGEFVTGVVLSDYVENNASTGGTSTGKVDYPDEVWVAVFDENINLKRIFKDDRLSYPSGQYRSQYYSQIGKTDDSTVYVFSGSFVSNTTRPCGALKLNTNATAFDADYYFNIEEKSGGYRFKRLWYISEHKFLLEFYNDLVVNSIGATTQYAILDMASQTFNWVTGIPAKGNITYAGIPMISNNKIYLPLTEKGKSGTIYIVDALTAIAQKGVAITGATEIRAIGKLSK